ncbi:MATE family efflux transporter [Anaerosacchariphilus polymeriproducens]|uniref:Probable multidrug resistance protein NorM n=1 Tax=Anaerosacchariphilus polymeriproducens TaxID=1812858 RepID=A0A371AVL2_9FIRM|nr:MATE family efflux transporter [Anaerosacchariphilus polymeriproducens]RDU23624.1 MATE family efflux transporter [Anaerosacchariphilus polymeriproducens]
MNNKGYMKEMISIGLPVTLQSIFQASYSLVDQLMVGSLGSLSIAGSGLGAKFSSLVTFTLSSVAAVASILIAQYHGIKDKKGINQSFFSCLYISVIIMLLFTLPSLLMPDLIMRVYTDDSAAIHMAAQYLRVISISFIPMTFTLLASSYLRSIEKSKYPMYASVISVLVNIIFNYIFIFGKFGVPKMYLTGAAIGTLIARILEAFYLLYFILRLKLKKEIYLKPIHLWNTKFYKRISIIILPIMLNECSWSIGENIYAAIYGRLGTKALAAMTITNPLQGMFIGMFSGVSSAAVVMVGKRLGKNENEKAYDISKFLLKAGLVGSIIISIILALTIPFYVRLFNVEPEVEQMTIYIVYALSFVLFAKILNMIMGGGILRSGGNTNFTMVIDLIGTWIFGVPLGLLAAFVLKLPIYYVYLILSLEEIIRLIIGLFIVKTRKWMKNIT